MGKKDYSIEKSHGLFKRAEASLPGGVNGNIKFRSPFPIFLARAKGAHIWDVDNNEYIDYVLSYGALILGHSHQVVTEALSKVVREYGTILFGNPNKAEIEFGELLLGIYNKRGKIRFTNSGLEATLLAVRLAMAYTGKRRIGKFDGHYHGANPFLLSNYRPINPKSQNGDIEKESDSREVKGDILDNIVVLPFNNIEKTREILDKEDVGAVILEPFEDGYIPAKQEFVEFLRKYTKEHGLILIFDEVKTGFRVRIGGAVEYYSVVPDLICLGKIIGGGSPIGAVVGNQEIMDLLDPRREKNDAVFHSGTFNGNPLSLSLGIATVKELISNNNFSKIEKVSKNLKDGISESLDKFGIPHRIYGEGGIVNYTLSDDEVSTYRDITAQNMQKRKQIDASMLREGVYLVPGSRYSLSLAHTQSDIDTTISSLNIVLREITDNNQLK